MVCFLYIQIGLQWMVWKRANIQWVAVLMNPAEWLQPIILPPPCLTVGVMLFLWNVVSFMADVRGCYKPFFLFAAVFFALYCVLIFVAIKKTKLNKQPPLYLSVDYPLIQLGGDVNTVHSTSEQNCRRKNMNTNGWFKWVMYLTLLQCVNFQAVNTKSQALTKWK